MKRLFALFTFLCSFLYVCAADITPISNALKNGDASTLAGCMDTEVDIDLPGVSRKCGANDAVNLLNAFFRANKPVGGFSLLHHADKKESGFFVGKLPVEKGEFRVNITYRLDKNKAVIQSIRIE
ncbi:MAG: DUF4783 domain-containing protein [Tannerellaceae bacterium]|jgi:hypothetical protein|nr:DUF4783 domain-containing protein [Tannerellaceae bacterium]